MLHQQCMVLSCGFYLNLLGSEDLIKFGCEIIVNSKNCSVAITSRDLCLGFLVAGENNAPSSGRYYLASR